MTDRYGIIGWPVSHSLSPAMHNAAFRHLGLDAIYERFPAEVDQLENKVTELKNLGLQGFNVTVPHKQEIIPFLDWVDPVAMTIGSVNTVVHRNGQWQGFSTDGYGLEMAVIKAFNFDFSNKHLLFIGAGGAALACAGHFSRLGIAKLTVLNRTVSKAVEICDRCRQIVPQLITVANSIEQIDLSLLADVDLVIQSTSIELDGQQEIQFPFAALPKSAQVIDMIYHHQTPFIQKAKNHQLQVAIGSDMLLYQGMKAFEIWTQVSAPESVMRTALCEAKHV